MLPSFLKRGCLLIFSINRKHPGIQIKTTVLRCVLSRSMRPADEPTEVVVFGTQKDGAAFLEGLGE